MYNKTVPRLVLIVVLVASFLFVPVTSVEALQSPTYTDNTYWRWWYVEQSTGVSIENAENTDYGVGTGEYISNNGGGSRADAYTWVKDKYDNAVNATANRVDYYYNVVDDIYNKSVDYAEKGYYTAENALRKTVDNAGKTVYNVSSSDFWNGFYNSMFNGGGYNNIYEPSNNDTYNGTVNNINYSLEWYGVVENIDSNGYLPQEITTQYSNRISTKATKTNEVYGKTVAVKVTYDDNVVYIWTGSTMYADRIEYRGMTKNENTYSFNYYWVSVYGSTYNSTISVTINGNIENENTTNQPTLLPSQMGFIINPSTGESIPVYTDTTQNPFTINPDGTVTFPDGTTVPIYVDPEDISGDGWLWLLKYIDDRDKTEPTQNPYGQPWNTQNDGTALGGFFSGLLSDISSLFSGLIDSIKKIFEGLAKIIADAIKNLIDSLLDFNMNDIQFSTPIEFNLIDAVVEKFFNMFGIEV